MMLKGDFQNCCGEVSLARTASEHVGTHPSKRNEANGNLEDHRAIDDELQDIERDGRAVVHET